MDFKKMFNPHRDETYKFYKPSYIQPEIKFSIGIVTFEKRYNQFFKPLLKSIKEICNSVEVIVFVNGNSGSAFDNNYRKEILQYCASFDNVFPHICTEFRSLSKLWNNILIFASNDQCLILNDDVSLSNIFFDNISYVNRLNSYKSFTINKTWSHVMLNRKEISDVGWFDERLLGVGEEDGDMQFRYERYFGCKFPNYYFDGSINHVSQVVDNNVKKNNISKYSLFNRRFISEKYMLDEIEGIKLGMNDKPVKQVIFDEKQYSYESFYWDNKFNL